MTSGGKKSVLTAIKLHPEFLELQYGDEQAISPTYSDILQISQHRSSVLGSEDETLFF
jgi:hypothetical protein